MSTVPFSENHELHGALVGLGCAAVMKVAGRPLQESLAVGTAVGVVAGGVMKTFGHDRIFESIGVKKLTPL